MHLAQTRRDFLSSTAAVATGCIAPSLLDAGDSVKRPKVAAIFTEFRFRSHTYNILENFFEPYLFNGKLTDPGVDIVSFYADQFPTGDMARPASKYYGIPLFNSIENALTLGGKDLAVDAVLVIGEHGEYPINKLGQKMYPRKQFFDQAVAVMKKSNRFVPLFNDKHLSYRWDWAKEMYDTAKHHGFPLMAGSSVPLAERRPAFDLPAGAEIVEAVSIHGGGVESYDFHGLEVLQSIVEGRNGGESGVSSVEFFGPERFHRAMRQGRWSKNLIEAAMDAEEQAGGVERPPWPVPRRRTAAAKPKDAPKYNLNVDHAIELQYKDGLKAVVLRMGSSSNRWNFACRLKGEQAPRATSFYNGPWGNRCLFKALSQSIQYLFKTQSEPYSVERTLLVSGILDVAMHSRADQEKRIVTPMLELAYKPVNFKQQREMGGTWKVITKNSDQPTDFSPGDQRFLR